MESRTERSEAREIVERAAALAAVRHSESGDDGEARRRLRAHGIDDAQIDHQLSTFASNRWGTAAPITTYSYLHSLQHLDAVEAATPPCGPEAEATITLFRCAEICLGAAGLLAERLEANLEAGRLERAAVNARWRAGLHELLYQISALAIEVAGPEPGSPLEIERSPALRLYEERTQRLHRRLIERFAEPVADIFGRELDAPGRFVHFHEFVNVGEERTWRSRLAARPLPGLAAEPGESLDAFYRRVVGSDEIAAMLAALETREETDLLPFRVVHQVSETIAGHVNRRLCAAIAAIAAGPDDGLPDALEAAARGNRMLGVADRAVKLMLRALTPRAYSAIRPNLGMVRGTSSVLLRRTLFNSTYPLLVRALELRLAGDGAATRDPAAVERRARAVLTGRGPAERALAGLLRELVVLHQHIRTWRDNHQQLPKTHLGVSPEPERPTVSLSGSEGAVGIAHELRRVHATDPVLPIYRAVTGGEPPEVHELLAEGRFDAHMAHRTAQAVLEVYGDVQERFYARRRRAAGDEAPGPETAAPEGE